MTYVAKNLADIEKMFREQAARSRQRSKDPALSRRGREIVQREAVTWDMAADILRDTILEL